jgi:hypothetical protein
MIFNFVENRNEKRIINDELSINDFVYNSGKNLNKFN